MGAGSPVRALGSPVAALLLGLLSLVALAGCARAREAGAPSPSAAPPVASVAPSAATAPTAAALVSPVVGVVVAVEASGLEDVSGFTLRIDDGVVVNLRIAGPLENAAEFPLGHLGEHVATAEPVRVFFRPSGGALVVTRIEDAG